MSLFSALLSAVRAKQKRNSDIDDSARRRRSQQAHSTSRRRQRAADDRRRRRRKELSLMMQPFKIEQPTFSLSSVTDWDHADLLGVKKKRRRH